jgi:zinc/manganese transport system substrate-binding protein
MRRRLLLTAASLVPFAAMAETQPLRAVASFSVLADMVRQVGGERVAVTSIVPPGGDAHGYQIRPADARAVKDAGAVVVNGLGLDNWVQRLVRSAEFKGVLTVATAGMTPRKLPGSAATDPHAWQDPRNGAFYAHAIGEGLATADPAGAETYRAAASRFAAEILRMDAWIADQFAAVPPAARRIITTHDAFGYFGGRFGIEFLAAQGISTEAEPSAKAIAGLVALIKKEKIRAVFIENMTDPRLAQMLVRETGAALGGTVYSDALSKTEGPASTYLDMLRHNTGLFVAAMRPS